MLRIGIVAGESSGDYLGAALLNDIRNRVPGLVAEGIGGPGMITAGFRSLFSMEKLSVMGLVEVMRHYRELSGIRNQLTRYFLDHPPDVFIGIDAPDFNLELERRLRKRGIPTVHYVSPQVWAWREYRLPSIMSAMDLMLVLYPFEEDYYRRHGMAVACVGHPLASQISIRTDLLAARARLGLEPERRLVALMPGSRVMELRRMMVPFLQAAAALYRQRPDVHFATSLLNEAALALLDETRISLQLQELPLSVFQSRAHDVLEAADLVLLASGTISLECMLFKKPMVVAYRMNWLSFQLIRSLVRIRYAALPNILAGEGLVPECLQSNCRPDRLVEELNRWLDDPESVIRLQERFTKLHLNLQQGATVPSAGAAVLRLLGMG